MSISMQEFRVAMETGQFNRLPDRKGSRYDISVPCFNVNGIKFFHSGSYYVVHQSNNIPDEIMNQAMAECGEKYPGGDNFWYGEIHSILGLLTLATMIEGRYTKELVDQLTNETYKKLLSCPAIMSNDKISAHLQKIEKLRKLVIKYDNIVNPFGNSNFKLKEPIQYVKNIKVAISSNEKSTHLSLETNALTAKFDIDSKGWYYKTVGWNDAEKGESSGYTSIIHYFLNGSDYNPIDEVISLNYTSGGGFENRPDDIDLRISLNSRLAWKTYREKEATLVTEEQIEIMITHLKMRIERTKEVILNNMLAFNNNMIDINSL